jgi:hypothetical protein
MGCLATKNGRKRVSSVSESDRAIRLIGQEAEPYSSDSGTRAGELATLPLRSYQRPAVSSLTNQQVNVTICPLHRASVGAISPFEIHNV